LFVKIFLIFYKKGLTSVYFMCIIVLDKDKSGEAMKTRDLVKGREQK
jgi:hypothetical protein